MHETDAVRSFRDLEVWNLAIDYAVLIYQATKHAPNHELFGNVAQVRKSAASISANIAEGSGRSSTKEFLYFLAVAEGSRCETESHLELLHRIGIVEDLDTLLPYSVRLGQMLTRLRQSLRKRLVE